MHRYRAAANRYGPTWKRYRETRNWNDETSNRYDESPNRYGTTWKRYRKTRNRYDETSNRYDESPKRYGKATKGLQLASEADAGRREAFLMTPGRSLQKSQRPQARSSEPEG